MIHSLKTWKQYFQQIVDGQKTFEVRKNDRGFKVGDILILDEYDNETKEFTGRSERFKVGFMLQGEFGLPADVCVMSLLDPDAVQGESQITKRAVGRVCTCPNFDPVVEVFCPDCGEPVRTPRR